MNKVIKKGLTITKTLVWNRTEDDYPVSECKLTFSDGSSIMFECENIDELEDENIGIYELLEDGTYIQIENWE